MDDNGGSRASDQSFKDLMNEYSSRPPQIAEWLWCIEYVAKFIKDIRCILDLLNMGYEYSNECGRRIDEVLSLRILEFMFDPSKNDYVCVDVASTSEARLEFDLSTSNSDVLREIIKEIPVSELRADMPELSKFNVFPFIAYKNMCLPQCALEKLSEMSLMENQTSAAHFVEANGPVFRDDKSEQVDTCEEEPIDEHRVNTGLEQNISEKDKVIVTDIEDEPTHTNGKDKVNVIDGDTECDQDTTSEPINNGNTTGETFPPTSRQWLDDARVRCTKDGTWLISGNDDDESDMVKGPASNKKNSNTRMNLLPSSSRIRTENACWRCKKEGTLLICSRSECASIVHKECLNCTVNVDEDGNFHCPVCWYDRVLVEYFESRKVMSSAKGKLAKYLMVLSRGNKKLSQVRNVGIDPNLPG